jgi:NAD(P)-dependent dehydrogenase (short-subunit alcohol dehydrogenase family)
LGRSATVDEIAATVRFLASQRSITGQMIALDGGQHLNWASPGRDAAPEE